MTDFSLSPALHDALPDYSEIGDYTLSTLNTLMMEMPLDTKAAEVAARPENMDDDALALLDWTLISIAGWSRETLINMGAENGITWVDMFAQELATDDENPFKETGLLLLRWSESPSIMRTQVDSFYAALCGRTLSEMLSDIATAIDNALNASA